jgi:hypothetical protein
MRQLAEALERRCLYSATSLPRPDHVVVLIEEDHSYQQILGPLVEASQQAWSVQPPLLINQAPRLRQLAANGASFTHAFSVGNSNLNDYQAIFSGKVPPTREPPLGSPYTDANIASELNAAGLSFGGYAESLPKVGYNGPDKGNYVFPHNPWKLFSNVPASQNMPFSKFPTKFANLPTVSYVVPNIQNDMHSGTIQDGDNWYQSHIAPYAKWALKHNSLLIVTWDESHANNDQIPTIFYGPMIKHGNYSEHITQSNILRTVEDMYGLTPTGRAAAATPITDIFKTTA